jgi:4-hydroxy-2-oxoheptanedioate aldolase
MEHTTFDLHDVQAMVMAAERVGVTPIVRTPGFDRAFILRLLDMGVQGVQVPHVSSAAVAREAVKAVRYPPEGERGMAAGSRAANFGKTPLLEHMAQSNREVLLACMIEDMEAVEQIEEIAAVDGVDLLLMGTNDFLADMGLAGQYEHPRVRDAYARTIAACRKRGKHVGVGGLATRPALAAEFVRMGARYVSTGTDLAFLLAESSARAKQVHDIALG